uniref:Uncharacterized protein n=1 Tax=Tanacetum cinerariifolium TaxID=118510 RepID=A0A699GIG3_TANCI|nr:hypothetical protein [Tanacetum cinerariifolium]
MERVAMVSVVVADGGNGSAAASGGYDGGNKVGRLLMWRWCGDKGGKGVGLRVVYVGGGQRWLERRQKMIEREEGCV